MTDPLVLVAERKIREAMESGAFDNLPGAGKPIDFDDDRCIPQEMRMAWRLLKNAGYIPPELEEWKGLVKMKTLIGFIEDEGEREESMRTLHRKLLRFNLRRKTPLLLENLPDYAEQLTERLSGGDTAAK